MLLHLCTCEYVYFLFHTPQIMLQGCNRFLKWVGLERANKPILGGPTLAGLPGGVVGDLQRLYPIRSNFEYPVCGRFWIDDT